MNQLVSSVDTATRLDEVSYGKVVICGSHGGAYPGMLAAAAGVRAIVLHDAGIGKDRAGIASLPLLEEVGIAAAVVASSSCRIGDPTDMMRRGSVSFVNSIGAALGVLPGMTVEACIPLLLEAPMNSQPRCKTRVAEFRSIRNPPGPVHVVLVDSASLVEPQDRGHIVVTGSHGGLISGDPSNALRVDALAAFFNDAGIGADDGGVSRLPVLASRGIAAVAVAAESACIGSAASTLDQGIISRCNVVAEARGARAGMPASVFARSLLGLVDV